jgi:RNA polymerase sigma factor (sigma-70 family)
MAAGPDTLLRYIRRLGSPRRSDPASDAALLARYLSVRDEGAFALLVHRHGPLVFNVCRRVLGDIHDAEDAFQATFMVLARKAATVHPREALTAWLHGVARRVALKARSARIRRCREDQPLPALTQDLRPGPLAELSAHEVLVIIDEEIQRMAEVYRLPVILCCLEGRSLEEAARELGWTAGSVRARLERGRTRLHDQLVRRGLTLSAALAVAEVSRAAASAAVVAPLAALTVRGAMAFGARSTAASGVSAQVAELAGETLRSMALAKLKIAGALLLATCFLATGLLTYKLAHTPATEPAQADSSPLLSEDKPAPVVAPLMPSQPLATDLFNAAVAISGRVLDPEGTPLPGARLYVGYTPRPSPFFASPSATDYMPRATSGPDGRFQFTFSRAELDAKVLDAARPAVIALASGFGPDWAVVGDAAENAELSLKLVRDLPLDGRILDPGGKPLVGAKLRVDNVYSAGEDDMTRYLRGGAGSPVPWQKWIGPFPGQPAVLTTDQDGRFHAAGFGRNRIIWLAVEAPDISHASFAAVTRPPEATPNPREIYGATFEYRGFATRRIRGVVRDKATGNPLPGVRISGTYVAVVTDNDGRYELLGCNKSQSYGLSAQPQNGLPYFAASGWLLDGPGISPLTLDFELVGGIAVQGRVTDRATEKPPKAAVVAYYPLFPNANSALLSHGIEAASSAVMQPDGSYRLAVLPGPGIVCVSASPHDFYAVAVLDGDELTKVLDDGKPLTNPRPNRSNDRFVHSPITAVGANGKGVIQVNRYHALSLIKPERTLESMSLDLNVQPARTLRGVVTGPDGKSLSGVQVDGLIATPEQPEVLETGSFTILGLNPRRSRELYFHHKELGLGKFVILRGDENKPLTVQLLPCGAVMGRMVDNLDKPVPDVRVELARHSDSYCLTEAKTATDAEGRFRLDGLVPGVKYTFFLMDSLRLRTDVGALEVKSGQSKDLGELVLEK